MVYLYSYAMKKKISWKDSLRRKNDGIHVKKIKIKTYLLLFVLLWQPLFFQAWISLIWNNILYQNGLNLLNGS